MRVSTVANLSFSVVALVTAFLVARVISPEWDQHNGVTAGMAAERLLGSALEAATKIAAERGPANGALGSELPLPAERVEALAKARGATDEALRAAETALAKGGEFPRKAAMADSLSAVRTQLAKARAQIDRLVHLPRAQRGDDEITAAVGAMIDAPPLLAPGLNAVEGALVRADPALTNYVIIARLTTEMRDIAGQLGSVFTAAFTLKRPLAMAEIERLEWLLGVIHSLDHQVRLAHGKTGESPQLAAAIAGIDHEFFGGGLPLVRRMLDIGRSGNDYGMTTAEFARLYVPQINTIVELRGVALAGVQARMAEIEANSQRSLVAVCALAALAALSLAGTAFLIHWRMTQPLRQISLALCGLATGDHQVALPVARWRDETGEVVEAMRRLAKVVRAREAEQCASSLVTEILTHLQTAETVPQLAQGVFHLLAAPMHIGVATFYRFDGEHSRLVAAGGYADQDGAIGREAVLLGEGLVGECALQRRAILLSDPPKDHLRIRTGLGNCAPRQLLILPVICNDDLVGVMEIGTLQPIEPAVRAAIDQLLPMLALRAVSIARSDEPRRG